MCTVFKFRVASQTYVVPFPAITTLLKAILGSFSLILTTISIVLRFSSLIGWRGRINSCALG